MTEERLTEGLKYVHWDNSFHNALQASNVEEKAVENRTDLVTSENI